LVPARHPQCDVGPVILHYLQTGDNQGQPGLDENYARYVHAPIEQARAIADRYIKSCDQNLDNEAAAQAQAEQQATVKAQKQQQDDVAATQARAADAQRERAVESKRKSSCDAIGGKVTTDGCSSTIKGNPSGKPGADCTYPDGTQIFIGFNSDGSILSEFYGSAKDFYPGCFK